MPTELIDAVVAGLAAWIHREECPKMIDYQSNNYVFKGVEGKIAGSTIGVGEISRTAVKLRNALQMALTLDDYQVLACKDLRRIPRKSPEYEKERLYRKAVMALITELRLAVDAYKANPSRLPERLDWVFDQMDRLTKSAVDRAVEKRMYSLGTMGPPEGQLHVMEVKPTHDILKEYGIDKSHD